MQTPTFSFLTDWDFWAVFVAFAALILTQLPPLSVMFRQGKITVEPYNLLGIQHKFGNPNAQLHLIFTNRGGRDVRIKGLSIKFENRQRDVFSLPATTYLPEQMDASSVLFVPFNLKSGEEWGHVVQFWSHFPRHTDLLIRRATTAIRHDLAAKRAAEPNPDIWVAADETIVAPFIDLFNKLFKWHPDDYELTLEAETEPANAMQPQKFRMVIFDPDSELLKEAVAVYKFGHGGVLPNTPAPDAAYVQLIPM